MIAYAVGEVVQPDERKGEGEGEGGGEGERWRPGGSDGSCYEVVAAWVHPSYRGLNMSIHMYLTIIQQGEKTVSTNG